MAATHYLARPLITCGGRIVYSDNSGYGEIRDAMDESGIPNLGTDISTHDLPAIARGFGVGGVRVRTTEELAPAVVAALGADGPTVIELRPEA